MAVLERGDIQFFFRPLVQPADAEAYTPGVQSFFAILSPAGGPHRRLRIGKKRMPSRSTDRFWGRIERVGSLERVLGPVLEPEQYTTKTRGTRYQPGARPLAHGTYAFLRADVEHPIHLAYRVEAFGFDDAPDEVPAAGSHVLLLKNATRSRAIWSPATSIAPLDVERTQLVLVGDSDAPEHQLPAEPAPLPVARLISRHRAA